MGVRFPDRNVLKSGSHGMVRQEVEAHASNAQKRRANIKTKNVIAKMCRETEIKIHAWVR
jgi:hypothetical protein